MPTFRLPGAVRRWLPALLAVLLCAGYYFYTQHQQAERAELVAAVSAGQLNADGAQVAAAANAAVPPFGLVAGKFVFSLGLFFGGLAAVWFVMRFVVPVLPAWATGRYTAQLSNEEIRHADYKEAFLSLDYAGRLRTFNMIWLSLLGYYALCVLAACLVS